jgi:hypothetical protein
MMTLFKGFPMMMTSNVNGTNLTNVGAALADLDGALSGSLSC